MPVVAEAKPLQEEKKVEEAIPTPPPVVETPPQPQGCEAYRSLIDQYDWDKQIAFAVMRAENQGCNPGATSVPNYNGTIDRGLFQVNSVHSAKVGGNLDALYDPATNVKIAYQIYSGSGWTAWSTYNAGRYLQFM